MSLFRFAEPLNILENIKIVMYKKRNLQFKSLFNSVMYDRIYNTSIGKYYFYTNIFETLFIPLMEITHANKKRVHRSRSKNSTSFLKFDHPDTLLFVV